MEVGVGVAGASWVLRIWAGETTAGKSNAAGQSKAWKVSKSPVKQHKDQKTGRWEPWQNGTRTKIKPDYLDRDGANGRFGAAIPLKKPKNF